ncbi:MAG: ribonuclease III [Aerococcus sp.]|nr:ribonuclease III [Aerococcus sp.]
MNEGKITEHFEKNFGIQINDFKYYQEAFTHSSYANEHSSKGMHMAYNERIEFLGDAVLELTVSTYIYKHYPEMPEGELSRMRAIIVCEESLSERCLECGFNQLIMLGHGEENNGARERKSLLCDLFEAVVGAIYLDSGLDTVEHFLKQTIYPRIDNGEFALVTDHKTELQEELQKNGSIDLEYVLLDEDDSDNDSTFKMAVQLSGETIGTGSGHNKKAAEQMAAKDALDHLDTAHGSDAD